MDSTKKIKLIKKTQTFLTVLAIVVFLFGSVYSYQAEQDRQYQKEAQKVADEIEISVTNKVNSKSSNSQVEFTFDFIIKNNSDVAVNYIAGVLKIMNADGDMLSSGEVYFGTIANTTALGYQIPQNSERAFDLEWEAGITDSTKELWEIDFTSLNISFELTSIRLENGAIVDVTRDAYIKQNDSNFEKSYQDALALFNQGKYDEAAPLFEALGLYKESSDYYHQSIYNKALSLYSQEKYREAYETFKSLNGYKDVGEKMSEITTTVLAKAEGLAATGDYNGACKLIEQVDFDEDTLLHQAYTYASQGNFAEAVEYGLTVVFIPEGVETIPNNYFKDRRQLKKVILPSTVKSIGYSAFSGCYGLEEINLPNGLTTIGNYAFYKCTSLKKVELPNTVVSLGSNVFEECTRLETVSTSTGLDKIPSYTFKNCTSLTTVTIKNGVEVVESSAFYGCTSLMTVTLPESLKEIQGSAFKNCSSLVEITIPAQVNVITYHAFADCSALQRVHFLNQEGWEYNYGTKLDVSDAQKNAKSLKSASSSTWERK